MIIRLIFNQFWSIPILTTNLSSAASYPYHQKYDRLIVRNIVIMIVVYESACLDAIIIQEVVWKRNNYRTWCKNKMPCLASGFPITCTRVTSAELA